MWSKGPDVRQRLSYIVDSAVADDVESPPAQRHARSPIEPQPSVRSPHWFTAWDPRARKAAIAMLAALGLVIAWWWWTGQPETVQPVGQVDHGQSDETRAYETRADDPRTPDARTDESRTDVPFEGVRPLVVVHVVGKVARPGVVELPDGSRVLDAIEAVGGATQDKALESVNLARPVVDGEQIVVGRSMQVEGSGVVSINSASEQQLDELPGVGPVIAERIVRWRETNGPFRSVDELAEVSGIGPAMLEQIRGLVTM